MTRFLPLGFAAECSGSVAAMPLASPCFIKFFLAYGFRDELATRIEFAIATIPTLQMMAMTHPFWFSS